MKRSLINGLVLASTFYLLVALPAPAQEISFRSSSERINTLRNDMLNITTKTQMIPTASPASAASIESSLQRIETASDAEIAEMYELAGPYIHQLSGLLDQYEAGLMELQELFSEKSSTPAFPQAAYPTGPLAATYGGIFDTNASTPSGGSGQSAVSFLFSVACTRGLGTPQSDRVLYQTRFTAKQAILLAELIKDVLGRLCDQEFYVLGVGTDFSLACIPSDLIFHALRPIEEFPAICDALIDSAEIEGSYDRLAHLHENLETIQSSITNIDGDLVTHNSAQATHDTDIFNSLNGSLATVTTTLSNTETTILNTLDAHHTDIETILNQNREYFLRTFIERALRRELGNGNSTPTSVIYRIATLYLPEAYGGNLQEVRDVVANAIGSIDASGEGSNDAAAFLSEGDSAFAGGNYKQAWDLYADAYIEALICPKNNPACR